MLVILDSEDRIGHSEDRIVEVNNWSDCGAKENHFTLHYEANVVMRLDEFLENVYAITFSA